MNVTPGNIAQAAGPVNEGRPAAAQSRQDGRFESLLLESGLKLSGHARDRLSRRDITIGEDDVQRLGRAVDAAEGKGSRSSLLLMDRLALIVNVPSRRIVTACDQDRLQDGVFTNIDSTVIVK